MKIKNFNKNNKKNIFIYVISIVIIFLSLFIVQNIYNIYHAKPSNKEVTELKKSQEKLSKVADQEIIAINKRLTNDQLSDLSANEILEASRDYALTLIGKVIPTTMIKTLDGDDISLNKKTFLVILNTGEKSKTFVEQLNKVKTKDGINYLIVFPSESNENVKKFLDETKFDTNKYKIATLADNPKTSTQPDLLGIAEYYFNAKGVPSYVSIVSNSITFAGSGNTEKMFENFQKKAFTEPYLYNEIK